MAINLDRGESLKLTLSITGDISTDKARVYISQKKNTVLKYSTDTLDVPSGFVLTSSGTYNATTNKTTFDVNIEKSESTLLTFGLWDITFWTSKTETGFSEGFVRMTESKEAIRVNEPLVTTQL